MPFLSFAEAWRAYRQSENRLPTKPPKVAPQRLAGIAAIADRFDLVVLDAWGVLNLGNVPIAGAAEAVAELRRRGKRLIILSNDGTREPATAAARHRGRGFDFAADEIVVGIELLPGALPAHSASAAPWGVIGDPPLPFPALTGSMLALGDDASAYDRVAGIVFLSSDGWSEKRQALLEASLKQRPRPLVVGNPDIVSPEPEAMAAEPGYYAHRLADAIGIAPIFCGKPFAPIYRRVAARHPDVAAERVLCVGDTLHTDILGGRAAGYQTLLIEEGFCQGQDALTLAADCGIWPDFIAPQL